MTLVECASQIPADPQIWPFLNVSKLPGPDLSWAFRRQLSGLFAGQDHLRLRNAQRLGVGLRPYEPGDRLKEMSWPHYARTEEIYTKTEAEPGRSLAFFLIHVCESMSYKGPSQVVNKGQVALALASIMAKAHLAECHQIKVIFSSEKDLSTSVREHAKLLKNAQWSWIFSDLFFEACEEPSHSLKEFLRELALFAPRHLGCVVVRDPSEQSTFALGDPQDFPGHLLKPFDKETKPDQQSYVSAELWQNLAQQEQFLRSVSPDINMYFVTAQTSLDNVMSQISASTQNARR
jgi:hypothetical protein